MIHSTVSLALRALFVSTLAAAGFAAGCTGEVITDDGSDVDTQSDSTTDGTTDGTADVTADKKPCTPGTQRACTLGDGAPGTQTCNNTDEDAPFWSACIPSSSTSSTPLVLSFERAAVRFEAGMRGAAFDLTGVMSVATDWPAAETPWLALDRDGDGRINDGAELFGSATLLASGARADNGFTALRELDANGDGRIDAEDPAFTKLQIWSDRDGDRASQPGEIRPLASRRLLSIDLAYTSSAPRCDARGNCEIERASFRYLDDAGAERAGEIIDVHLRHQ